MADAKNAARSWLAVIILLITAVIAYTDRQVLSLLVDPMRADLGLSDTGISLLMGTAFALTYGVAGIPLGWLADRLSRRGMILAGLILWSAATVASGFAANFTQLFIARLLVGLGEAVLSPAAISLISDSFPPEKRGTAVGTYLSGIAIGIGCSILIGGAVLHVVEQGLFVGTALAGLAPWRLVLITLGLPGALWSFALLAVREPVRQTEKQSGTESGAGGNWRALAGLYAVVAIASLVDNAMGAWSPSLLIRGFGKTPAEIGVLLGLLLMVGYGGGVLAGGILSDRAAVTWGARGKARMCMLGAALALPVAGLLLPHDFTVALLDIPLYFAVSGIVTACGFSAILDSVPANARGLAMAISFFLNVAIGASAGPAIVALAGDHLFGAAAGLAPPLAATILGFNLLSILLLRKRV